MPTAPEITECNSMKSLLAHISLFLDVRLTSRTSLYVVHPVVLPSIKRLRYCRTRDGRNTIFEYEFFQVEELNSKSTRYRLLRIGPAQTQHRSSFHWCYSRGDTAALSMNKFGFKLELMAHFLLIALDAICTMRFINDQDLPRQVELFRT